ncbi:MULTISPECIES: NUDIX domain-containing protein [Bacillaceae]|uniref:NUDIX hydrolase n=1 Tax=Evansella alkalicola TaxID=745819 RepID=A0ABS6JMQ7_9BACI|nr:MULTISPECIES: NUDIX hydrolase [Bacillaceae]MBU9719841.1 NUDIX hydrolase [Bacillus alkalicola]
MVRKAVGAIVLQKERFLLVNKTKINTNQGKQEISGEWDFVKGGVEDSDQNLTEAVLRELYEETGSREYKIVKEFTEKICFEFPEEIKSKIGYDKQETTMFLVELTGDANSLQPEDSEIWEFKLLEKNKVADVLTHQDTKDYFLKYMK